MSPGASCRRRRTRDDASSLTGIGEAVVYLAVVVVIAVIAIRLGMLLAPRLDTLLTAHEDMTTPDDEDDGGRPD